MKTAMQELFQLIETFGEKPQWYIIKNTFLEKEKQQIVETFNKGTWNGGNNVNYENGHDFYNQTYNQ
jgi:hypothetical protein